MQFESPDLQSPGSGPKSETASQLLPGDHERENLDSQHQPKEKDPGFTHQKKNISLYPTNMDVSHIRAEIQGWLAATASDSRESVRRECESLSSQADKRMANVQATLLTHLHTSFTNFRDEQDRRERKITDQINTFNKGISTLQKSLDQLSQTQRQSHATLQQASQALERKIDAIAPKDEQYARSLTESLQYHNNQMETLVKSHLDMLAVGQPHGRMIRDGHEKLEQKIDTVLHNDQAFARRMTETLTVYHNQMADLIERQADSVLTSYQQSHTMLHQDHQKLEDQMATFNDQDQGITRTLTKYFKDNQNQMSTLAKSHYDHQQALDDTFTTIADDFNNIKTLIRDCCVQTQVTQPGGEKSEALRRKRAAQVCWALPSQTMLIY